MRRKIVHPYGQSGAGMRVISMLMATLVLFMLYERLKDPTTWRALADDIDTRATRTVKVPEAEPEDLVPGPNDLDEEELAKAQESFEAVVDFAPRKFRDMRAYWQLMDWSRTQPLSELEERARDDIPFAQLWEQPERYRGKLIYLRMHLLKVTRYEPEDGEEFHPGIKHVYEAWGNTDESLSFPYCVVFTNPPADLPIGKEIRAEVVFVGYFLKIMTYTAFDHTRGTPLLVGRLRVVSVPKSIAPARTDPWMIALVVIGAVIFIGYSVWFSMNSRKKSKIKMLPKELSMVTASDGPSFDNFFNQIDSDSNANRMTANAPVSVFKVDGPPANSTLAPAVNPTMATPSLENIISAESASVPQGDKPSEQKTDTGSEAKTNPPPDSTHTSTVA